MIKEILYKWFGLEPMPCATCEVLRAMLDESNRERRNLLERVLAPSSPPVVEEKPQEFQPILPQHVPWRVRQQMLEAESRHKAQLMKEKEKEIEKLEKELGVGGTTDDLTLRNTSNAG